MRFMLINPHCPLSEGPTPPLGIAYVAAALEAAGIEVRVLDLVTHPHDRQFLEEVLASFRPQIVGSTAVTMTFNDAKKVLQDIKAVDPDILTVMGGPHVTFCARETLESVPELDLIVLGEGEATVVDLATEADGKRDWSAVKGLAYRNGGEVRGTEARPLLDVNTLPMPARHLLPLGRYRALNMPISTTTSRGCPFPCIFCVGSKMVGPKVRYRHAHTVVDELAYLAGLGFPQVNIADDLFTAKKDHCLAICDEILARKLDFTWSCFSRVDTISPPVLERMKEAGCKTIGFGVETANAEILKTVRKGITIPKVVAAIEMSVAAGIDPHVSFILGLPGETPATLNETLEFGHRIEALGASYGFHLLAPFPGTAVRERSEEYGVRILSDNWSDYHANRAIVETPSVDRQMLDGVVDKWSSGIIRQLAATDGGRLLENLHRTLFYHSLMMTRAIEETGTWRNGAAPVSQTDALETLARNVCTRTDKTQAEAHQMLSAAVANGHLSYSHDGEFLRWQWTEHL